MTVMNFIQLMRSWIIRVNNCACVFHCFAFQTSRPHPPPFTPHLPAVCLGCFSKWHPGLWPWSLGCDHWRTSGEGLSGAAPSRWPRGPPSAAAAEDFSAALAQRPSLEAAPAEVPPRLRAVAVPGGRAACAPGPGASEPRASPAPSGARHCGWARAAAQGTPTAGGRLAGRQARAAATSGKAYKWAHDTLAQLSSCLRGCLDVSRFLCNPVTWLGRARLMLWSITCPPALASQVPLQFWRKGRAGGRKGREGEEGWQVGFSSILKDKSHSHLCFINSLVFSDWAVYGTKSNL